MLITASKEIKFINWPELAPIETYTKVVTGTLLSISWSKNNAFVMYLVEDKNPEIVSLKDGNFIKPIHVITAIDCATRAIFSHTRNKIIAIGTKSSVVIYDTSTKTISRLYPMPSSVVGIDFNKSDCYIGVACHNGEVMLINMIENTVAEYCHLGQPPSVLRFHPYIEDIFGIATLEGQFSLCDVTTTIPVWSTHETNGQATNDFAFCPDHARNEIVSVHDNNKASIFSITGKCLFRCTLQYPACAVAYTTDGKTFIVGLANGAICLFDTQNPKTPKHILKFHSTPVTCLKFANFGGVPTTSLYKETLRQSRSSLSCIEFDKQSSKSTLKCHRDDDATKTLQADMINDVRNNFDKLHSNLNGQLIGFAEFMHIEFQKFRCEVESKYNVMSLVNATRPVQSDQCMVVIQDNYFTTDGNPVILE